MKKEEFGRVSDNTVATLYTLENKNGMKVKVTDFGATLVSIEVKDKNNVLTDVVLGYDSGAEYENSDTFFGANVCRNANRISDAKCGIEGVEYKLEANDGKNNLHSGKNCTAHKMWEKRGEENENSISFKILSRDMEQGFPGNMEIILTYTLLDDNTLKLSYKAKTDKTTVANFTNHSYYNLNGHSSGSIYNHVLKLNGKYFTPVKSKESIPTGEIRNVQGTPFDFTKGKNIGKDIHCQDEQLAFGSGYDHNFVIDKEGNELVKAATAYGDKSGIVMELYADTPGIQLYTANFVENESGKNGAIYQKREAFCLEPQYFPNHINERNFKSGILLPDEEYHLNIQMKFYTRQK